MDDHHVAGPEHRLERLVFFSDAVFAIAITLLVIEVHAPHLPANASMDACWEALLELTPSFLGFFISFFVIGAFWAGHHRGFACARRWSDRLVGPNLLLLFAVAALPFFTALLSSNITARLPALIYCAWLALAGLFNIRLQHLVTAAPIVDPAVDPTQVAMLRLRGWAVVIGAAFSFVLVLTLPFPSLGLLGLATINLWRRLLTHRLTVSDQRVATGSGPL